jgi:hypothetical protein
MVWPSLRVSTQSGLYRMLASSSAFPLAPGACQNTCNGNKCILVTKLNPRGTALVWSTFVVIADYFGAIQLDAQGNVYVAGHSNGLFQGVDALQPGLTFGSFVSYLDPTGSTLLFSSQLNRACGSKHRGLPARGPGWREPDSDRRRHFAAVISSFSVGHPRGPRKQIVVVTYNFAGLTPTG